MKALYVASILLLSAVSFNAKSTIIKTQELVFTPLASEAIEGESKRLFSVLSLGLLDTMQNGLNLFNDDRTILGFSNRSVSNIVTESEVANQDGSRTRISSDVRVTTNRTLLGFDLKNIFNIDNFSVDRISFNEGALFFDFSELSVNVSSSLVLDILFSAEESLETINQRSIIIPASDQLEEAKAIPEPTTITLFMLSLCIAIVLRQRLSI